MNPSRVLVCGGRSYANYDAFRRFMDIIFGRCDPSLSIIHGAAPGADSLASRWAKERLLPELPFPAAWHDLSHPDALIKTTRGGVKYDARAGHRRNQRMIDEGKPDLVVAFPGGRGTADMVRRAKTAKIVTVQYRP